MAFPKEIMDDDLVTLPVKSLATIFSAIKNLQEHKGSTPREIIHYISLVHNIPADVVKRKLQPVLKRGVAHGILREANGRYNLSIDNESESLEIAEQELGLLDFCSRMRQRKRQARNPKRRTRKSKARKCRSRCGKVPEFKQGKGILGIKRKTKTRKKTQKIVTTNEMPKKLENNQAPLTPIQKQPVEDIKKFRLQSRTPCSSKRSSCVREIAPETLSVV